MKRIFTLSLLFMAFAGFSQAPQLINYQGVARTSTGTPISHPLRIFFEILEGSVVKFTETKNVSPNSQGLFSTQIGSVNSNSLSTVTWTNGPYSLRVSMDTTSGGTGTFTPIGSQTIVSVPYALHAASAPDPNFTIVGNVVTVGTKTQTLPPTAGLQNLSINGNTLSISGGTADVVIPPLPITGSGATIVSPIANGYDVNTPSVTLTGGVNTGPPFNITIPSGLAQVMGSYPNYSIIVTPTISYSQQTGSLTLSNIPGTTPTYVYNYNITPTVGLIPPILNVGPAGNQVNLQVISPWRTNPAPQTMVTVSLATISASVGIGVNVPTAKLEIDGFTKLGSGITVPAIKVAKLNGIAAAGGSSFSVAFPTGVTSDKVLSITVMVNGGTGANLDWYPPDYTSSTGYQFNWRTTNNSVVVESALGNSANIAGKTIQVMITYEP